VAVAQAKRVNPDPTSELSQRYARTLEYLVIAANRDVWIERFEAVISVTAGRADGLGVIDDYPPAIAAAIADALTDQDLNPRADAGQIVAGAVTLALQIADPERDEVQPRFAWEVRNTRLIDPLVMFAQFMESSISGG
jgi:hypothetical protein